MIEIDRKEIEAIIIYLRSNGTMNLVEPVVRKMENWLAKKEDLQNVKDLSEITKVQ